MGAAGAGGSDKSDDKKVDTYSDQLKKEQARKSKFKTDKFGYTVKKNIGERYVDNHPVIQGVKNTADKLNLNRRMKFANKNNINLQGLNTEQILSKDFKSQLDAKGYTKEPGNVGGGKGNDRPDNDKNNQTPPVATIMPVPSDPNAPNTSIDLEPSETEKKYDARKTKKKGRNQNLLTSAKGVTKTSADYSLGKKSLLGRV